MRVEYPDGSVLGTDAVTINRPGELTYRSGDGTATVSAPVGTRIIPTQASKFMVSQWSSYDHSCIVTYESTTGDAPAPRSVSTTSSGICLNEIPGQGNETLEHGALGDKYFVVSDF